MLWDLNEGKHLYTLEGNDIINALSFSPNRYWLCAAVGPVVKIWVSALFFFVPSHSAKHTFTQLLPIFFNAVRDLVS
jgi:hypothetical protein